MKNKIYIIDGKTYLNHINDESTCTAFSTSSPSWRAGSRTRRTCSMCWTRRSATARSPRRSSRLGHPRPLPGVRRPQGFEGLMDKELDEVVVVPEEEPKPKKYRDEYIIPGYGFRMLVGDIHHLIVLYYSLARRLSEAETEKDFLRLKKKAGGYEKALKKLFRSLGLPEGSNAAQDSWRSPSSAAITWSAWRMWRSPRTRETLKGTRYGATDSCEPVLRHWRSGPGGGGSWVRDRLPV